MLDNMCELIGMELGLQVTVAKDINQIIEEIKQNVDYK